MTENGETKIIRRQMRNVPLEDDMHDRIEKKQEEFRTKYGQNVSKGFIITQMLDKYPIEDFDPFKDKVKELEKFGEEKKSA